MIVQLQPEQIAMFWEGFKNGLIIANRVPKVNQQNFCNNVLERLLAGKAQAWIGFTKENGENHIKAFGITTLQEDQLTGERHLFLHSIYAYRVIPEDLLQEMLPTLDKFAKASGCTKLLTFTSVPRLVELYKDWGFTQDTAFYQKDI